MMFLIYILVCICTLLFLRDLIFRIFFIYPRTDWTGNYAAFIEEKFIPCWIVQNLKKRPNIEVVFLGNSHLIDAIDPFLIEKKTGMRAYNVALYSIASQYSMELLSMMNYYPKLIFIDISTRYSLYNPESKMIKKIVRNWSNASRLKIRLLNLADKLHFLAPSLFVPFQFLPLSTRAIKKIREFKLSGRPSIGRYTPFRLITSYSWQLNKMTNHRVVRRRRKISSMELAGERYLLNKCINETDQYCKINSDQYNLSFEATRTLFEKFNEKGTKIVILRLPLHPDFIRYENATCGKYFEDFRTLRDKYGIDYLDLNEQVHLHKVGDINFYGDGQHVDEQSSYRITNYISELINQKYKTSIND